MDAQWAIGPNIYFRCIHVFRGKNYHRRQFVIVKTAMVWAPRNVWYLITQLTEAVGAMWTQMCSTA